MIRIDLSFMYRQGDILLISVPQLPIGCRKTRSKIILQGELTGHSHRITAGTVYHLGSDQIYVQLDEPASIVHEEHAAIELPVGIYRVIRQHEYIRNQRREVMD